MKTIPNKILYWVKFVSQDTGRILDSYFTAETLSQLEENIAEILEVKVIRDVADLTATQEQPSE